MRVCDCFSRVFALSLTNSLDVSVHGCALPFGATYKISSQEELDNALQGCTSVTNINIVNNYTGSFTIPDTVTSIWGLSTSLDNIFPDLNSPRYPTPNLTSIVAYGLTMMHYLDIGNAPSLVSISFPNVSQAEDIYISEVGETFAINFSSLGISDTIEISANISRYVLENDCARGAILAQTDCNFSVDFPLLNRTDSVTITGPSGQPGDNKEFPSMNISFPVLSTAPLLNISGSISRFESP